MRLFDQVLPLSTTSIHKSITNWDVVFTIINYIQFNMMSSIHKVQDLVRLRRSSRYICEYNWRRAGLKLSSHVRRKELKSFSPPTITPTFYPFPGCRLADSRSRLWITCRFESQHELNTRIKSNWLFLLNSRKVCMDPGLPWEPYSSQRLDRRSIVVIDKPVLLVAPFSKF